MLIQKLLRAQEAEYAALPQDSGCRTVHMTDALSSISGNLLETISQELERIGDN